MADKKAYYRALAKTLIPRFAKRNMEALYAETKEEAKELVLSMIPEGAAVTNGGSMSLKDCGILDALMNGSYTYLERTPVATIEERHQQFLALSKAEYFLMGTNAFTADGELVNIDGSGNRLAMLLYGPPHVIVLAGMNKFAKTREEALDRVHNVASPPNCMRLEKKTPCAATGECGDCHGPDCICGHEVITRHSIFPDRIKVILVGEELGF